MVVRQHNIFSDPRKDYTTWTLYVSLILTLTLTLTHYFHNLIE